MYGDNVTTKANLNGKNSNGVKIIRFKFKKI